MNVISSIVGTMVAVITVLCLDNPPWWLSAELGCVCVLAGQRVGEWFE